MENDWEIIKQKKTQLLEKDLELFIGKLEKFRSNRISLEAIRELTINYQRETKLLKSMGNLSISPNHELIIRAFESKTLPLIIKAVLESRLGYKKERNTKEEVIFTLLPMNDEIRKEMIRNVKKTTEEGKKTFRLIRQDIKKWLSKNNKISQDQKKNYEKQADKLVEDYNNKLVSAEEKKIRQLSS